MKYNQGQLIRKLTKLGTHSFYVVIPPQFIRNLKWRKSQKLVVEQKDKTIIIKDWKR